MFRRVGIRWDANHWLGSESDTTTADTLLLFNFLRHPEIAKRLAVGACVRTNTQNEGTE